MSIFEALLINIIVFALPYIISFIILVCCILKHNMTFKKPWNKYNKLGKLFGYITVIQSLILIIAVLSVAIACCINTKGFSSPADCLLCCATMGLFGELTLTFMLVGVYVGDIIRDINTNYKNWPIKI